MKIVILSSLLDFFLDYFTIIYKSATTCTNDIQTYKNLKNMGLCHTDSNMSSWKEK